MRLTGLFTAKAAPTGIAQYLWQRLGREAAGRGLNQPFALGPGLIGPAILLQVLDDHPGDVLAGGDLDALQPWRRVYLHHQRPVVGAQDIHTRHAQPHHLGRPDGGDALFWGDFYQAGDATPVQVGAELARFGLTLHRGNYFVAYHEASDICATGLLDVLLHHDVLLEAHERFDHRLGRLGRFAQHHANALGAFQYLDHQRGTVDHLDQVGDVVRRVGETGDRQAYAAPRQQLQRAQLVARAGNGYRLVERVYAHHFELAQHRAAIERNRSTYARDHGIEAFQRLAAVVDLRLVAGNVHVGPQGIDHHHFVATLGTGFDQAAGGIQTRIARQHSDLHAAPVTGERVAGKAGLSCTYFRPGFTTSWPCIRALEPSNRR